MNFIIALTTFAAVGAWMKLREPRPRTFYLTALAATSAHLMLNVYSTYFLAGSNATAWAFFLPNLLIHLALLAWLWLRPGLWPAGFIAVYTAWSLVGSVRDPANHDLSTLFIVALHVTVIAGLALGVYQHRKVLAARSRGDA